MGHTVWGREMKSEIVSFGDCYGFKSLLSVMGSGHLVGFDPTVDLSSRVAIITASNLCNQLHVEGTLRSFLRAFIVASSYKWNIWSVHFGKRKV